MDEADPSDYLYIMAQANLLERPLLIYSTMAWPEPIRESLDRDLSPHALRIAINASGSNLAPSGNDEQARRADVVFGQPHPDDLLANPNLKLVQLSSAGYTRYDNDAFREAIRERGVPLCTASGVYDEPCAQHALAMILAGARMLPQAWLRPGSWNTRPLRSSCRLLNGQTILLVGFGAIARRLAGLLAPLDMKIVGVRREPLGNENTTMIRAGQIDEWLPRADHVVNLLPASESTRLFFDHRRLRLIKSGSVFYNIGRGDTVDQSGLEACLRDGHIRAAFLDVTTPEPLPADHPLWSAPNCFISPHIAGGHDSEGPRLAVQLVENVRRLLDGRPLLNRVL